MVEQQLDVADAGVEVLDGNPPSNDFLGSN